MEIPQPAGQQHAPSASRNALVLTGLGLILLLAVAVLVASATALVTRLIPSTSARSSGQSAPAVPSRSPTTSPSPAFQASEDELRAGDCLTGSDLSLDTSSPWPDLFTVVPCNTRHIAEVFFAGNIWRQSLAYPRDDKIYNEADNRCAATYFKYIKRVQDQQEFTYQIVYPDDTSWPDGDWMVVCIAYKPTEQYPGGAPVNYSLKGSRSSQRA